MMIQSDNIRTPGTPKYVHLLCVLSFTTRVNQTTLKISIDLTNHRTCISSVQFVTLLTRAIFKLRNEKK